MAPEQLHSGAAIVVKPGDRDIDSASRQQGVGLPLSTGAAQLIAPALQIIADREGGFIRQA
ncbi:hypothetical protein GCM10007937_23150 [Mesorhizobium albiziae]|nr:hypothetical protein GCM10007937_23150 [Mesorhizobium albiziae]